MKSENKLTFPSAYTLKIKRTSGREAVMPVYILSAAKKIDDNKGILPGEQRHESTEDRRLS